jgi:indolepyruvate ferredoxin oxidoreductase
MDDQPHKQIDATFPLGGEGVGWIGLSPFTDLPHVFQNQGDGSLFHSSYLNIRFSIAAGVDMTYKILFNGYVANTGAQEAVGAQDVPTLVQLLALEGAARIAIIARDPKVYARHDFPSVVTLHGASEVDVVLAELAATKGTTIFLYDGECANERRRRQKRGKAPKSTRFVVINEDVCENCGDCGEVTNCMSLHKADTEFGQKTRIHQSSCNQDTSCIKGDCPSFITVLSDDGLAKPEPVPLSATELRDPVLPDLTGPYHVYIPGVGGTGVLTINSLLCWAAMLDGHDVGSYDQTGAAQKWGAVLSSLVITPRGFGDVSNKAGLGSADLYLAVDAMASADKVNLDRCSPDKTAAVINTGLLPSGSMVRDVDLTVDVDDLVEPIRRFVDPDRSVVADAKLVAEGLFGDYMATNMVAVGMAYQAGLLPISAASIEEAISTNGAAVEQNIQAFRYGRLAQQDPARLRAMTTPEPLDAAGEAALRRTTLKPSARAAYDGLMTRVAGLYEEDRRLLAVRVAELIQYQDVAYAERYVAFVLETADTERRRGDSAHLGVTREVIRGLYKLMAYKDEYEVARLHLRGFAEQRVTGMFEGRPKLRYNLHPPTLRAMGMKNKISIPAPLLNPVFRTLVSMRRLRGGPLDVFGRDDVRRQERELIDWYCGLVTDAVGRLTLSNRAAVLEIARLPETIRGYESIKTSNIEVAKHSADVLQGRLTSATSLPLYSVADLKGTEG